MDNDTVEKIIKRHLLLVKADGLYLQASTNGGLKDGLPMIICSCSNKDLMDCLGAGIEDRDSNDVLNCKPGWLTTFKSGGGAEITRVRPRGEFFKYRRDDEQEI